HNQAVKFVKFECISDNTKKFTVGKIYYVRTEHAKHTVALTDDRARHRLPTGTHNGEGLLWNSGGTTFSTFGKKRKRTFCVKGNVAANNIHNVKPSEVDRKPAIKPDDKLDLPCIALGIVILVTAVSLVFIMEI